MLIGQHGYAIVARSTVQRTQGEHLRHIAGACIVSPGARAISGDQRGPRCAVAHAAAAGLETNGADSAGMQGAAHRQDGERPVIARAEPIRAVELRESPTNSAPRIARVSRDSNASASLTAAYGVGPSEAFTVPPAAAWSPRPAPDPRRC